MSHNIGKATTRRARLWALLEYFAANGRQNKWNVLGKPYQKGRLELHFGWSWDAPTRARFEQAFESLKRADLIRSDFADLTDPANWVEITERGRRALDCNVLDALDEELIAISPRLVEMRDGAWASLESEDPDSLRQAADSGFELVSQALKLGVSDDDVKRADWFKPHPEADNGVTREHRARWMMEARRREVDPGACEAVAASAKRLGKLKHGRFELHRGEVELALDLAECALKSLLVAPSEQEGGRA